LDSRFIEGADRFLQEKTICGDFGVAEVRNTGGRRISDLGEHSKEKPFRARRGQAPYFLESCGSFRMKSCSWQIELLLNMGFETNVVLPSGWCECPRVQEVLHKIRRIDFCPATRIPPEI
jgi:hypothetical protein